MKGPTQRQEATTGNSTSYAYIFAVYAGICFRKGRGWGGGAVNRESLVRSATVDKCVLAPPPEIILQYEHFNFTCARYIWGIALQSLYKPNGK